MKKYIILTILSLCLLNGCGKDDKQATNPPAPSPAPTAPAPAPAPKPAPPTPPAPPSGNGGQTQPQNGQCFCDDWGCYTCDTYGWCCEVNSCGK